MLMTLPLAQMIKAQREVNQTNQVQAKINRSSNVCYTLNPLKHIGVHAIEYQIE